MSLSRLKSLREKRSSINKKDKPRLFSGDLYGSSDEKPRKSLSLGSAPSKAGESSSKDDSNVLVQLLLNTQSLLASAWGMHSGLPPIFISQVPRIQKELSKVGIVVEDETVKRVLRGKYANGDPDKAIEMLITIEDSRDGVIRDIRPNDIELLGAENNGGVTCYLDSLLFAMFARLDAFEAMLYNPSDEVDEKRKKLTALLRLFVNLLRTGKLITTDIISQMQQSIAECGWDEASSSQQQDPSELFGFITDILQLPLLTVKVDIAHGGKEVIEDDHKFINERLLNLSLPEFVEGGLDEPIPLEACMESYFHGRIDVKRQLERQATLDLIQPSRLGDLKGPESLHIETADLGSQPNSPVATPQTPLTPLFQTPEPSGPSSRLAQGSLVRTVKVENEVEIEGGRRKRAMTLRKEILLPAWCFFSILPFYTASLPQAERSSFAEHFSKSRPILGLCLKRYSYTPKKGAQRDPRRVDIPLVIALPTFVSDDEMGEDDGRLYGNFKLVLQSAICHRGNSVNSGHYIALVRSGGEDGDDQKWLRFDDLNLKQRVAEIDHKTAFAEESPYLLFYQVQPIDSDETVVINDAPPSVHSFENTSEKRLSILSVASSANSDSLTISGPPEPTINEPPSYENHQSVLQLGTSPPPAYSATGFLSLPGQSEPVEQDELLRPTSRSPKRPGSKDGPSIESVTRRSKSEMAEKRSSWASLRLGNRGKSQDKLSFGSRKSGEWKREDYSGPRRPSEDSNESEATERASEEGKEKGKEKEKENISKEGKEEKEKDKKDKGKGKDKSKSKEITRECVVS